MNLEPLSMVRNMIVGYLLTIGLETPVLFIGLGKRYSIKEKLIAGALLTGCSYPFVALVFPMIWNPYDDYNTYVFISEIFAPICECLVFALLFQRRKALSPSQRMLDLSVVVVANLFSYGAGELMKHYGLRFG